MRASVDRSNADGTTVLMSVSPPDGTTKYVDQVVTYADDSIDFLFFTWRNALLRKFRVLHIHWPESFVRGRNLPVRLVRLFLTEALIFRLQAQKIPVVRTLHNPQPHERGAWYESLVLRQLDRLTSTFVVLNAGEVTPFSARTAYIPHGDYRERFSRAPQLEPQAGRILYFGRVQPYKGIDTLIAAFTKLGRQDIALRLVGQASKEYALEVSRLAKDDDRISSRFEFVSDGDLVAEVKSSELVILPYQHLHNSGVLLFSLSLDRPTLAPRTPTTEALQREVGSSWLRLFDGVLDEDELTRALQWARPTRPEPPTFDPRRSWDSVGRAYSEIYRQTVAGERPAPNE